MTNDEESLNQDKGSPVKPLKRIRLENQPFVVGLGGTKQSKDAKLIFIDKTMDKHHTLRMILEDDGKLVMDIHTTDETKDKKTENAHTPILKMVIDSKALERDTEKLTRELAGLTNKMTMPIENGELFKDGIFIPIVTDNRLLSYTKSGKEATISETELTNLINSIKGIEDLEHLKIDRAMVQKGEQIVGVIFKKAEKWCYLDMVGLMKAILLLYEPYMKIEGGVDK